MLLDLWSIAPTLPKPIHGVLHIGAHFGQEDGHYQGLGINNRIYFEPLKSNYDVLVRNVQGHKCYNFGLGASSGTFEMYVESANNGMSCSLLEPKLHMQQYPHIRFHHKQFVQIKRLDDVEFDRSLFNFINIDVQGYELEVFKGSMETLKHIDYIMAEVNLEELYKDCVRVSELDAFLANFGFKRTHTNWAGVTWGDAFYTKL